MRHIVVMQKVPLQRREKLLRVAVFETDLIIDAGVIHERIDVVESRNHLLHNRLAVSGRRKIHGDKTDLQTLSTELQLLTRQHVPIHSNCDGAFLGAGPRDSGADTFCAARHQDDLVFELQVHDLQIYELQIYELQTDETSSGQ